MATGDYQTLQIYDEQVIGAMVETEAQAINVFNEASNYAITLTSKSLIGHYAKETFFDNTSSLVARRDITDVSTDVTDLDITADEIVSVKLNRRLGPIGKSEDAWRKIGKDNREMSRVIGVQFEKAKLKEMVDRACAALVNAIDNEGNAVADVTSTTIDGVASTTHGALIEAQSQLGDRWSDIVAIVGHSNTLFDLQRNSLNTGALVENIAGLVVNTGSVPTMGLPFIVSDSPSLYSGNTYYVLLLTRAAAKVINSEETKIYATTITGKPNLIYRVQGEYAYNLGLKGYEWGGGVNPTNEAVATGSNWTYNFASVKDGPGVLLKTTLKSAE